MIPLIFGFSGPTLAPDERALFADCDPAGYILFGRNIDTPDQVRALTDDLRALSGRGDLPILIDQEGGRIQRLGPPHWPDYPAAASFGDLYDRAPVSGIEAARLNARAIADDLRALGISVDCLPLVDVPVPGAHDIIGDRAFAADPNAVAALGHAVLRGLRASGVCGIVKHIPGHGRAKTDSHLGLPVVDAPREALEADLEPFCRLRDAPMAMTAHVTYTAWDAERCASLSPIVVEEVIRGAIGFDGFLMCDDLTMHALEGSMTDRLAAVIAAGCDAALHCSGNFAEMRELAASAPPISEAGAARLASAMAWAAAPAEPEPDLAARRDALLAAAS